MTAADLKALRKSTGLTQTAFAARLGVSLRAVQFWESGQRRPSGSALILLGSIRKGKAR